MNSRKIVFIRIAAAISDLLVVQIIILGLNHIYGLSNFLTPAVYFSFTLYRILSEKYFQTTLFKRIFGLVVLTNNGARITFGTSIQRSIFPIVSSLIVFGDFMFAHLGQRGIFPGGLVFFIIAFDVSGIVWTREKKFVHDVVSRTYVIKKY